MVWLNCLFLLGQAFIPFPAALLGEYPTNPLAVSFFGVVMMVNTLLFLALQAYIVRYRLKPEREPFQHPHFFRRGLIGPASYLLGAALAWAYTPAAFAVYLIN